jgi:hypothetical protein
MCEGPLFPKGFLAEFCEKDSWYFLPEHKEV